MTRHRTDRAHWRGDPHSESPRPTIRSASRAGSTRVSTASAGPVTELRLRLLANDYEPVPVVGKRPVLTEWQKIVPSDALIRSWTPSAGRSTGLLTRRTSCLDGDVPDPDTMEEIGELVRDRFDDCGTLLTRFGNAPKRAFLFRTDAPFKKKRIIYLPPGMAAEDVTDVKRLPKIEFLCDGQQVVAFGIHEDTKKPYSWHAGRDPTNIPRSELPVVDDATADQLMADIHALLLARGYRVYEPKPNGHDKAAAEPEIRKSIDYAAHLAYDHQPHSVQRRHRHRQVELLASRPGRLCARRQLPALAVPSVSARAVRRRGNVPPMAAENDSRCLPPPQGGAPNPAHPQPRRLPKHAAAQHARRQGLHPGLHRVRSAASTSSSSIT